MNIKKINLSLSICFLCCLSLFCQDVKIDGLTVVAPPGPMTEGAMDKVKESNAGWITLVPFGFTRASGPPRVVFDTPRQWWGERPAGVRKTIQMAKARNLKVMIKPQVYMHGLWIGDLDYKEESDWIAWEKEYFNYVDTLLSIAEEEGAEMFCIGTECKKSVQKRTGFWNDLIAHARSKYSGKLTYSSNWDSYNQIPFWDKLDYIGVSAYFPLTPRETPNVDQLKKLWRPIVKKLSKYARRHNKQMLFTEFGYLSVDGCAYRAWELEKKISQLDINEQAQMNAYEALFSSFWNESFWAGGFLWKWFPDMQGHEGYPEKDYTPQGKLSEKTINDWYEKT